MPRNRKCKRCAKGHRCTWHQENPKPGRNPKGRNYQSKKVIS